MIKSTPDESDRKKDGMEIKNVKKAGWVSQAWDQVSTTWRWTLLAAIPGAIIGGTVRRVTRHRIPGLVGIDSEEISGPTDPPRSESLEVWPESHWPGFALRQSDVFQSYAAQ